MGFVRRTKKMNSSLTPAQFARELPACYDEYTRSPYSPGWFALEPRLTAKAVDPGYLNLEDLVEIAKWGGNQHGIAGRVFKANTDEDVIKATRGAIESLDDPRAALRAMLAIRQWGLTYGSKTLRAVCPQNYGALDSLLLDNIDRRYMPASEVTQLYVQFLRLCEDIRQGVAEPGPRQGKWFIADVEMGLFQFVWNKNKIV